MPSELQNPATKGKKRKSVAVEATPSTSDVQVIVSDPSSSAGPVFVNFPSVRPGKNTPYTIYTRDPGSSASLSEQRTLLVGETEDIEFFSTNRLEHKEGEGSDCQYLPALFDPSTNTLHINAATPLHLITHRAKRLRTVMSSGLSTDATIEWKTRRNDLGEAFGTRKAKSQIRAEERNRVDVSAMEGVKGHLMESIGETEVVERGPAQPSEFIPVPNLGTHEVQEVYPRDSLIPADEWAAISVSEIIKTSDDKARMALLPYRRSRWIEGKMRSVMHGPSGVRKTNLKYLYYLAALLHFQDQAAWISKTSAADIPTKFRGVPSQVLNGLLTRFAESVGKKYTVTDKMRTKLLAWICTLYILLDGWSVEIGKVAKELSISDAKVSNMYKMLGCSVELPTTAEREQLGLSLAEAQKQRRAVLKAPVKFPKTKRRGPAKR